MQKNSFHHTSRTIVMPKIDLSIEEFMPEYLLTRTFFANFISWRPVCTISSSISGAGFMYRTNQQFIYGIGFDTS